MITKIIHIDWIEANSRCKCGFCNHQVMRITFDDGSEWFPTHNEIKAIKDIFKIVLQHNLRTDKHCYKKEQSISIKEVLE